MKDHAEETKIIFFGRFINNEILSGPEKTAKRLFVLYSKETPGIFVQYFFDGRAHSARQKLFGYEKAPAENGSVVYTLGLFRIYAFLLKHKPDIVHLVTFERFAVIIYLYKLFNQLKIIYNSHGVIFYENSKIKKVSSWHKFKDKLAERIFLKFSDKLIFPSEQALDKADEYFTINEVKTIILPNGIDRDFSDIVSRHDYNNPLKAVIILKNEFSESGARYFSKWLNSNSNNVLFYIIGSKQANILPVNQGINLVKPMATKELGAFYIDKNIFLQLNEYETFSIAAAEAMAAGLIPIVTEQTGLSRYVEHGYNGYIIEYGNTNELDSVMRSLINAPSEQLIQLSQNARKIYSELAWDNVYEMYSNIYREMTK